jgi:pyruvate/2-oxoglutarate dehydrogenase complex dihydrolipoamide dehydrogenase (E3) component
VDDTCAVRATGDPWLYALGDVNRHALLTHQGKYQVWLRLLEAYRDGRDVA